MIVAKNLKKRFKFYKSPADRLKEIVFRRSFHKDFTALDDVSFEVGPGETLGIIGQNGAGKSTLLKILTGVLMPDAGTVSVDGRITGLLELGTGFNPEFSGLENIAQNGTLLGMSRAEIQTKRDAIIEFSELGEFIHEPIKTYSSGMVMRLAFSVVVHADPQAFVVDEALAVGDAHFQQKCMRRLKELKAGGVPIIFVSHDMNAIKVLSDRVMLLMSGRVVESGDPETVINAYNFHLARKAEGGDAASVVRVEGGAYGNQRVRIERVEVLDGEGREADVLVTGKPASIRVLISSQKDLDNATVGILIRDRFGQDIFGTNSCNLGVPLAVAAGERRLVTYDIPELNIGPGKYSVTVATHSGDVHVHDCYHWIDAAKSFEVVAGGDFHFIGLSRLKPVLTSERYSEGA